MLEWTIIFLVIAVIAGVFGFAGIASVAVGFAKIIFFVFLALFIISLVVGALAGTAPAAALLAGHQVAGVPGLL